MNKKTLQDEQNNLESNNRTGKPKTFSTMHNI